MKRSRRVRRLHEVRPLEVAKTLETALQRDRQKIDEWLSQSDKEDDEGTPLTRLGATIVRLTAYAQGDDTTRPKEAVTQARKILADMLSNMIVSVSGADETLEKIDPYLSELTVICSAVLGRYRIEIEKLPVPDAWLAALCSIKTGSVRTYLCLPDKPTVFLERPSDDGGRGLITYQTALNLLERRDLV